MNPNYRTEWARIVFTILIAGMLGLSLTSRASAQIIKDIGNAGKNAGKGIGKGGKAAGKGIGKGGKDAGKGVGKGGEDAGKGVAKGGEDAGKGVEKTVSPGDGGGGSTNN